MPMPTFMEDKPVSDEQRAWLKWSVLMGGIAVLCILFAVVL